MLTDQSLNLNAPITPAIESLLTPEALAFIFKLESEFRPRRRALFRNRALRQQAIDAGETPDFLASTNNIRQSDWQIAPVPPDLQNRHVEITGPTDAAFQDRLAEMGYKFQFVTLAGFHTLNAAMFELAHGYADQGMTAYSKLQQREFQLEREAGYQAVKHQSFVGAGYFDHIQTIISGGHSSTTALKGSTEEHQFDHSRRADNRRAEDRHARHEVPNANGELHPKSDNAHESHPVGFDRSQIQNPNLKSQI